MKKYLLTAWKITRIILITLASLVMLLIIFAYLFEDKIKKYAVEELNKYLTAKVEVDQIELSFLARFPYASLEFSNVRILDPPGIDRERDTLIHAESVFLEFSIWDVLKDDYKVKNVTIRNGSLDLFIDHRGNANYQIWKTDTTGSSGKFSFDLEQLYLKNSTVRYANRRTELDVKVGSENLVLSGIFTDQSTEIKAELSGKLYHFNSSGIKYLKNKQIQLETHLINQSTQGVFKLKKGLLALEKMRFSLNGSIVPGDSVQTVDLNFTGNELDVASLLQSFVPEDADKYKASGKVDCTGMIKGDVSREKLPAFSADFSLSGGKVREPVSGIELNALNIKGSYSSQSNEGKEILELKQFTGRFKDGEFNGFVNIKDLPSPEIKGELRGHFELSTLTSFLASKELKGAKGSLDLNTRVDLSMAQRNSIDGMKVNDLAGALEIRNFSLPATEQRKEIHELSTRISLGKENALLEHLKGKMASTTFSVSGAVQNLVPFLLGVPCKLNVVGDLEVDRWIAEEWISESDPGENKVEESSSDTTGRLFPSDLNFILNTRVGEMTWRNFKAESVTGDLKLLDERFSAANIRLLFAEGVVTGNAEIDARSSDKLLLTVNAQGGTLNISEMFRQFDNFGQGTVTDKNLKGILSTKIEMAAIADRNFRIDTDKLVCASDITLEQGELNQLSAMKDIAEFLITDPKVRLVLGSDAEDVASRLDNIRFSTLTNRIEIRNNRITIPRMEVSSSALNIQLFGTHSFSNEIDYHINFRFLELKSDKSQTEYGFIEDDGTGLRIFIRMFGTTDDPKFEADGEERKRQRQEYNKQEVQNIKSILKEEFGLFGKDSTVQRKETPKEEVKFLMEWEEESIKQKKEEEKEKKEESNKKRMEKLKKKLNVEEENKEVKVEIE